jgi:hypothetical protein
MRSIVIMSIFALALLAAILLTERLSRRVAPQKSNHIVLQYSSTEMNRPAHAVGHTESRSMEGILPAEALNQKAMQLYQTRVKRNLQQGDPSRPPLYASPTQVLFERSK